MGAFFNNAKFKSAKKPKINWRIKYKKNINYDKF